MAGFDLYADSWITEYVNSPDFAQYVDYFDDRIVTNKSEQEISAHLDEEEYFYRRSNKTASRTSAMNKQLKLEIFDLLKYYTAHPLTLKQLSRIAIRNALFADNSNIKRKIENSRLLPNRLKDYLLLKEFNI
jgi:hypothetical protein